MRRYFPVLLLLSSSIAQESRDQLGRHWDYDASTPLNVRQSGVQERQGIAILDITYRSPLGDRAAGVGTNGGNVTAYLVLPSGKGPFPAVIFGHWCMPGSDKNNRTEFLDEAVVLAQAGVLSLLPNHVTAQSGFPEDETLLNDQQIAVEVQQVINLRRGADLLVARKDVDPKRLAYVGHSCDGTSGAYLSGIDQRFKAFVIMAGQISYEVDRKMKWFQKHRQAIGPERFDAFWAKYAWMNPGMYVSHAAPASVFLQYAAQDEATLNAMEYLKVVSAPKRLKIYQAPHSLNAAATRDRIAFLARELYFKQPAHKAVNAIPVLFQPPWPDSGQ